MDENPSRYLAYFKLLDHQDIVDVAWSLAEKIYVAQLAMKQELPITTTALAQFALDCAFEFRLERKNLWEGYEAYLNALPGKTGE